MQVILRLALVFVVSVGVGMNSSMAAPCSGNDWQPTFVHDLDKPDGPYYVVSVGNYKKLTNSNNSYTADACRWINSNGVRNPRGFTTCQDHTRIQCGCVRSDTSNTTCRDFLSTR